MTSDNRRYQELPAPNADHAPRHHCRIRYVVTCSVEGDLADVETITEGSFLCEEHEAAYRDES